MELKFIDGIRAYHVRLSRRYTLEAIISIFVLFALSLTLIVLELFTEIDLKVPFYRLFIWITLYVGLFLFIVIYFPLRYQKLQNALNAEFFKRASAVKIDLIPNPLGGTKFDYNSLLKAAGISVPLTGIKTIARYEFTKRLFHVLYFNDGEKESAIIHLPMKESPYYLQISNGNFAPPEQYEGTPIVKIAYVSPYNLQYYATSSATNAKIYLRKEIETRFVKFLKIYDAKYQYVATYNDEFLKVEGLSSPLRLRLGGRYDNERYARRLASLRLLQSLMLAMLERGK
ncbi:MAG: hypothetical protein ACOX3C_01225 [Bacilli bacterium]|jgi:hypothetical protein